MEAAARYCFPMLLNILAALFDFIPQVHHKRIWQS
jgi:hypothetical protein